jgi:3D (Asp-Asp-Asp) domain-containing protein
MIKNILIVMVLISLVSYSVEKKIQVDQLQEEIIKTNHRIAITDSLMEDNTLQALQLVAYLDDCGRKIDGFKKKINDQEANKIKVVVTMYHPVPEQTDSTPNITADGTVFRIENASDYRYIAVAQNMLVRNGGFLDYGDWVVVDAGKKSGLYQVRDTMARRWINRIDILETPGVIPYKYNDASLRKLVYKSGELN